MINSTWFTPLKTFTSSGIFVKIKSPKPPTPKAKSTYLQYKPSSCTNKINKAIFIQSSLVR